MTTTASAVQPSRAFTDLFSGICSNVERVVRGKPELIRLSVTCLVAHGHLLIEDVPGVGKTSLAKALARSVHATFGRVQFTPDLLPSDVLGTAVYNQRDGSFDFRPGPIFCNLLLGDEVNRASPKTQSALLEAMAEEQVTVDGNTYALRAPFMVIATQNPLDHQGTFPLPESQLDRFLMRLSVGYPGRDAEIALLTDEEQDTALGRLEPVATAEEVVAMGEAARHVHVAPRVAAYLVEIAERTRSHQLLAMGVSPRATLGLQRAARVWAAAHGRDYITPDDVKTLAHPVLDHRLVVGPEGHLAGVTPGGVLDEILGSVPVPD